MCTPIVRCVVALLACGTAHASTWYVNNVAGNDTYDGTAAERTADGQHGPFATLGKAVFTMRGSDALEIANTGVDYREMVTLNADKSGRPGAPTVIDGHGATIDALDVPPVSEWRAEPDGAYSRPLVLEVNWYRLDPGSPTHWIDRPQLWFVDGRPAPNALSREDLLTKPGGFWHSRLEERLYFLPPVGRGITDVTIEIPMRGAGIFDCADHTLIRNLTCLHAFNDGIGTASYEVEALDQVFVNCTMRDNADQGFSAHGTSTCLLEDCTMERNGGCGITDVGRSTTVFRRCRIIGNTYDAGAAFPEEGYHAMYDCIISGNENGPQVRASGSGWTYLQNCLVVGIPGARYPAVECRYGGGIRMDNCTIVDAPVGVQLVESGNRLAMSNTLIARCPRAMSIPDAQRWVDYNGYDLGSLLFGGIEYTRATWADYQKASGHDEHSLLAPIVFAADGVYDLPADSPYHNSGYHRYQAGGPIGARLPEWK